jgi:cell division inhibitor SulA
MPMLWGANLKKDKSMKINNKKLDAVLGKILDTHKLGQVSHIEAINVIAHIVAAVAMGNETEVQSWLNDEATFETWLKMTKTN